MPKTSAKKQSPSFVSGAYAHGKAKVSSKGWVVIPKAIRDALGIEPGDELSFTMFPPPLDMKQDKRFSSIHIMKVPKTRKGLLELTRAMFPHRPGEQSLTEQLLRDRREEREREERGLKPPTTRRRKTA
ncbi:MAG: AbrB/MazE/SpoVT family DNA-binding domain-containing protein [Dehalococcoidia bacterium]